MRTKSYLYHVQRRDWLAHGERIDYTTWERFSAESEDLCSLIDAFTVYGEQASRDADCMFNALANPHGLTPRQRRRAKAFHGIGESSLL